MATRLQVAVLVALVCLAGSFLSGAAGAHAAKGIVGAPKEIWNIADSLEIDELANFAVDQYKARQNSVLLQNSVADMSFARVLSGMEQVVQGTMYYLTIEVIEGGEPKQYDAKVWVKPWESYRELESFLPSAPSHYDPAVDLTAKLSVRK